MALLPLLFSFLLSLPLQASSLTLTGDEVYVINKSAEPQSVVLALRDVMLDIYMVLGRRPAILSSPPAPGAYPNTTTFVYFGSTSANPWLASMVPPECTGEWERHCVTATPLENPSGYSGVVVATGAGARGAIYGLYAFSERVLGVNPWKWFTDDIPSYSAPLTLPSTFSFLATQPKFKYRGLFINDEDLLANLFPDPLRLAAISLATYDRLLETLLRLGGNLMVPATNPFPDQQVNALCSARGVALSFHHYDLLGGNVFSWPLPGSDWDWGKDPGTMSALWRSAIDAQGRLPEVVWSVGLRGLNDYPYPCDDGKTPALCGGLISQALGNQTTWIRAVQPNATIILYMWSELLALLVAGHIVVPQGVEVVFADAGRGYIEIDGNWSKYCNGVYYHSAMYDLSANQLTEMVPVDRMITQFKPVVEQCLSTTVLIDNVSDLRPVPMTTEAMLRYAWDPTPFNDNTTTPAATAAAYYAAWGARQHAMPGGASSPTALAFAALWADILALPYLFSGIADNFYGRIAWEVAGDAALTIHSNATISSATLAAIRASVSTLTNGSSGDPYAPGGVGATLAALVTRARALQADIPPSRSGFYTSHTLTQVLIHQSGVGMVLALGVAVEAVVGGDWVAAQAAAQQALVWGDGVLEVLRAGELASAPAIWRGWYAGDYLTNLQGGRDQCRQLLAALVGHNTAAAARAAAGGRGVWSSAPPLPPIDTTNLWYLWDYEWQGAAAVAGAYPLSQAFNPAAAFSVMPRCNCVFNDVDRGVCTPGPEGGVWVKGAGGAITLQVMTSPTATPPGSTIADPGDAVRFTLDGSTPTPNSPGYVPGHPLVLDDLVAQGGSFVNVTAGVFKGGVLAGAPKTFVWKVLG